MSIESDVNNQLEVIKSVMHTMCVCVFVTHLPKPVEKPTEHKHAVDLCHGRQQTTNSVQQEGGDQHDLAPLRVGQTTPEIWSD